MRRWWQRFVRMPDEQRARWLAYLCVAGIVIVLYGLGGASLYVRRQMRAQVAAAPTPGGAIALPDDDLPVATPAATPILAPVATMTPQTQGPGGVAPSGLARAVAPVASRPPGR
jgi:hypothetical protein